MSNSLKGYLQGRQYYLILQRGMFGLTDLCIQAKSSMSIMVAFESDGTMPKCLSLCVFMLHRFHYQLC